MASQPKKWMKGAVRHPGALRATAKRMGMIKGDEKISSTILGRLSARAEKSGDTTLKRRVNLAKTFAKSRK